MVYLVWKYLVSICFSLTNPPYLTRLYVSYANSVLQALYFCSPFRELLLQDIEYTANQNESQIATPATPHRRDPERKPSAVGEQLQSAPPNGATPIPASSPTLFAALRSLFLHISTSPGDKGCVAPRAFIEKLKELNELFRSTMHQDAHEFLNYLLNQIVEEIEHDKKSVANGEDRKLPSVYPAAV